MKYANTERTRFAAAAMLAIAALPLFASIPHEWRVSRGGAEQETREYSSAVSAPPRETWVCPVPTNAVYADGAWERFGYDSADTRPYNSYYSDGFWESGNGPDSRALYHADSMVNEAYIGTATGDRQIETLGELAWAAISTKAVNAAVGYFIGEAETGVAAAKSTVQTYEVGTADALKARSVVGDALDIHHVGQASPLEQIVPGYSRATGPAIALPEAEHGLTRPSEEQRACLRVMSWQTTYAISEILLAHRIPVFKN